MPRKKKWKKKQKFPFFLPFLFFSRSPAPTTTNPTYRVLVVSQRRVVGQALCVVYVCIGKLAFLIPRVREKERGRFFEKKELKKKQKRGKNSLFPLSFPPLTGVTELQPVSPEIPVPSHEGTR